MEKLIEIYTVQPNDCLISIGERIGMTADELRDFHNRNCEQYGLMWFNTFIGIEKLVLPKNFKSEAQLDKEIKIALPDLKYMSGFYAANYTVQEFIKNSDEKEISVGYDVELISENRDGVNLISVKQCNFRKDGQKPDEKMSEIAIQSFESLGLIKLQLSENGKVTGIDNHKEILDRFKNKEEELKDFFIGEINESYFKKFEENISNESYFFKQLTSTLLYQTFFPNRQCFQNKNLITEHFYPVNNSFSIKFECNFAYNLEDSKFAETIVKSRIAENFSLQEILRGVKFLEETEEPAEIEFEFKYFTDKETKSLQKAEGKINILHDGDLYQERRIIINKQ